MSRSTAGSYSRTSAAFTLIELMISIALVLVMMLGVNYVFSSVGQATGLTQAISRVTRDTQAAQAVMYRDFSAADMSNAPFIVIRSFPTLAFRNREDLLTAVDPSNPATDTDPVQGPFTHVATSTNNRIHRTDVLLFFARDKFSRQTGGGTFTPNSTSVGVPYAPFIGDMATQEAMIWYGHLKLPDDSGVFSSSTNPGRGPLASNPNNFFANQWILGRMAILLQEPDAATGKIITRRTARDPLGVLTPGQYDVTEHDSIREPAPDPNTLDPLQSSSRAGLLTPPDSRLDSSRYDLAATSMATMRSKNPGAYNPAPLASAWWEKVMSGSRFQAQPFVLGGPGNRLTPAAVALQAPIFVNNCSQFMVEFAGDFMTQNDTGNMTSLDSDGVTDFNYDTTNQTRSIRWYGYPRNTAGDARIRADQGDVVPVRDYRGGGVMSFERTFPLAAGSAYELMPPVPARPHYICAWDPDDTQRPSMFRILFAVDDPNGRFADPLTFEYVFKVP